VNRPDVLVLDVNETLSDLEPLRDRLVGVGLPGHLLETWFASTLRDGFALTAAGAFATFRDVAADNLRLLAAQVGVDGDRAVGEVLAGFPELPPHPDVGPGLRDVHRLGVRLVTLTNGASAMSERLLGSAGVLDILEHRLSVEEPRRWKPHADAYRYAADVCGVAPDRMALAAVHPWDVDGAVRAGLSGVWIDRRHTPYPSSFRPPDLRVESFQALATAWSPS